MKNLSPLLPVLKKYYQATILTIIAVILILLLNKDFSPKVVVADFYKINSQLLTFKSDEKHTIEKSIKRNDVFKKALNQILLDQNLIVLDNRIVNIGNNQDITDQLLLLVSDIKQSDGHVK